MMLDDQEWRMGLRFPTGHSRPDRVWRSSLLIAPFFVPRPGAARRRECLCQADHHLAEKGNDLRPRGSGMDRGSAAGHPMWTFLHPVQPEKSCTSLEGPFRSLRLSTWDSPFYSHGRPFPHNTACSSLLTCRFSAGQVPWRATLLPKVAKALGTHPRVSPSPREIDQQQTV
jgi:hypothetical protein